MHIVGKIQELHFSVGERFGLLLTQIAREHLIYNYNPEKAMNVLRDGSIPDELILSIIKGDHVITTDVENQTCHVEKYDDAVHADMGYECLDIKDWCERSLHEISSTGRELKRAIEIQLCHMRYNKVHLSLEYEHILKFIDGDSDEILDSIHENEEISQLEFLIYVTKRYLDKSIQIKETVNWFLKSYPDLFTAENSFELHLSVLYSVQAALIALLKNDRTLMSVEEESMHEFVDYTLALNEAIEVGLNPVNIVDNYSAGWLAPDATFYGFNGPINAMIHNSIASALQEQGVIPKYDSDRDRELGVMINPDLWLEQHGWVKIHDDNINFDGCNNDRHGHKNVDITPAQIEAITLYINTCRGGLLKCGWKRTPISAALFEMTATNSPEILYERYFKY